MTIGKPELIRLLRGEPVKHMNGDIVEASKSLKYILGELNQDINDLIVEIIRVEIE